MLIINDVHIGVQRKAGTTPASQEALRSYLFESLGQLLNASEETHLLILGDLFDEFEVSPRDWVETYHLLSSWLEPDHRRLTLVAGNHDHSPKGDRVSSFQMLCEVLKGISSLRVQVVGIDQWDPVSGPSVIALAHCSNQDIFNQKLAEVLDVVKPGHRVLLHANWNNNFTAESDHSLNVSREQAKEFAAKGATLYFAHVHQATTDLGGSVVVFGNQWPTSVQDCLGNDEKYAHILADGVTAIRYQTWPVDGEAVGFCEIDWSELGALPDKVSVGGGFIRVTGTATSAQASEVINAIAKFRQHSSAFVITNAVKVEGIPDSDSLPEQFEVAKRFDVMQYIRQHLTGEEEKVVEELLKEQA